MSDLDRAYAALGAAGAVVAITGAGISAESGVPTVRGAGGLWRSYRAEDLATPGAFARNPALVWEWYWWRRGAIAHARPNPGHLALASFERRRGEFLLLTQNVDGLHVEAGSRRMIELHGNIWRARCTREPNRFFDQRHDPLPAAPGDEGRTFEDPGHPPDLRIPRCSCGALLRPDVVWFGEALDPRALERAVLAVRSCDVLLVVGTSTVVYPVAALPAIARRGGATVVEVNVDETPLSAEADIVLRGPSGVVLPELERRL
jgi:NAD-dependent deacetylase